MRAIDKYRFAVRTLPFLHAVGTDPAGTAEIGGRSGRRLLVWHPDAISQVFRADRRMTLEGSDTLGPLVGDRSLLFANGPRHAAYRQVIGPALRGRRLDSYRALVADVASTAIDQIPPGTTVVLPEWSRMLALRIIGQIVLSSSDENFLEPFTTWVEGALGTPGRRLAYRYLRLHPALPSPWGTFLRKRAILDEDLLRAVLGNGAPDLRPGEEPPTLAALLRTGRAPLGPLDPQELRDQIVSLLFAGHETTASAIAWTLYWLDRNEQTCQDVRDELGGSAADGSVADEVPLLDAACQEALRISPPAMLAGTRVASEDGELAGHPVAAGTRLTPCIYLAHRRPEAYPDPGRFDPRRFMGTPQPGNEYVPFGGGTRRCLGVDLAMLELRMVVAAVLRQRRLRCLNPGAGVPHLRGPAMVPGRDLAMVAEGCPS